MQQKKKFSGTNPFFEGAKSFINTVIFDEHFYNYMF